MEKELIEKIKSRGYWRVNFQPPVAVQKLKTLGECKEMVEKNTVALRGWDYPHFPRRKGDDTGLDLGENFYQGWIDWKGHIEFWRMYQSGQFLHYSVLREDWFGDSNWTRDLASRISPGTALGVTGSVVFQMTEIFEFLSRLAKADLYGGGVRVVIELVNTKGRKLWVDSRGRIPFSEPRGTSAEKISFEKQYLGDSMNTRPAELALEAILFFFDHFGWHNPPIEAIKKDQEALLSGRP